MQHPYIPNREQAETSLARFYEHLGHRPLAPRFGAAPRLSGTQVHANLGATVRRLRRADPAAAIVRQIPPARLSLRIRWRRFTAGTSRLFDVGVTVATLGFFGWVILPAGVAMIAGKL